MHRFFSRYKENLAQLPPEKEHLNLHAAIDGIKGTPRLSADKAAPYLLNFDEEGQVKLRPTLANANPNEEKREHGEGRNKFTRCGHQIYAFSKQWGKNNKLKHSSMLDDLPAHAAGEMHIANRKIIKMDNFGGHFRASKESILLTLNMLEKAHLDALSELQQINIYELDPGFELSICRSGSLKDAVPCEKHFSLLYNQKLFSWTLRGVDKNANPIWMTLSEAKSPIKELSALLFKEKYRDPLLQVKDTALKKELKEKILGILQHHFGFYTSVSYSSIEELAEACVNSPACGRG